MPFEKLKNPPLIETICEFRFSQDMPWDSTVAGMLLPHLESEFPVVKDSQPISTPFGEGPSRTQFWSKDESALVQVGDRLLSANLMGSYGGWENSFRPLICFVLDIFRKVKPHFKLERVGLRYINRIPMLDSLKIEDFIHIVPNFQGHLDKPLQSLFQRYELLHEDPPGRLIHQSGISRVLGEIALMLDLDFVSENVSGLENENNFGEWIEAAHSCIINSFNDSVAKTQFKKMKEG